jgi:L-threonylcarbamoyladenylate synthase
LFRAVEALRQSEVIVFPTETFYGLGANALDEAAVARVVSLKGRGPESPISVIIADEEMLNSLVTEITPAAKKIMSHFWPGPLTLVLPAKKGLPAPLLNRQGGLALRISSHPMATQLVRTLGSPVTATSANPSGKEPARTLAQAQAYFSGRLRIFVDGGELSGKKGSTVVEISDGQVKTIREGEISREQLAPFLK